MANTKNILEKIRVEGVLEDLIAKSNGENVSVQYNGSNMTLAAALSAIYTSLSALPTTEAVNSAVSTAIDNLIDGAPGTYDTLKEIADYIAAHEEAATALNQAIGNKVDKVEGKGLSTEDFTTALKTALENLNALGLTADKVSAWDNAASAAHGHSNKAVLDGITAEKVSKWDGMRGVRYGTEAPNDMQDGELFVRIVSE